MNELLAAIALWCAPLSDQHGSSETRANVSRCRAEIMDCLKRIPKQKAFNNQFLENHITDEDKMECFAKTEAFRSK